MAEPLITVSEQSGTNNSFDVTSVGFDTEKQYTVAEFNQALKKANEKWQENWDGLSYPNNIVIVTVENLHNEPCTYRINLTDADYNSIQDIVDLSPTPMHASISTEKAIEVLNKAETNAREQGLDTAEPDKTFAYKTGARSEPFTVIVLDIRSEERKETLSYALNSIINSEYFKANSDQALPYKDILKMVNSSDKYMQVFQGYLSCLKYALREANDNELCAKMLDSIHHAENNITRENEYREPFQLGNELNKAIHTAEKKVEHIPQQRDISHNTSNAALSATGRKDKIMATKMECTGMVMLAEGSAKAVATVTINDEFALKGIKVYDGENGLFAAMPSRKIGGEYQDVAFPITAEARAQLNSAVLETYGKLVESGLEKLPIEKNAPPEKSTSKISVSLHMLNDEKTKAVGQIVIDDSIVVSGVKVRHGTNAQGEEKDFVSMPSYQTHTGEYKEYALPVTKDCYEKVNKAVLGAYETLQKTEHKGVNLSELGAKGEVSSKYGMNNEFAEKLMAELDKQNIPYSAKVAPNATTLSVKNTDRAAVDKVQKALTETLSAEKKAEQNQQQPKQQTQPKPKKSVTH